MKKIGQSIIDYMVVKGYVVRDINIVYIEGVNPDTFTLNDDQADQWNDTRNLITDKGEVLLSCTATTEPGEYYTSNPMNRDGCARIAFGQYLQAWEFGMHHYQKALVQVGEIEVYRDLNRDGVRTGDCTYKGLFGINQHTTGDSSGSSAPTYVGKWSAGCLVGKFASTHYESFLPVLQRYNQKRFDTTILDGSLLHQLGVLA